jgi:3D (Asp-Asp-Asp) domain-containing protein
LRLPVGPARFLKTQHVIAAFIAATLGLSSTTGFAWANKSVTLVIDGRSKSVSTQSADVASLLSEAGVSVGSGDLVSPVSSATLDDGSVVVVRHVVPVTLDVSGQKLQLKVLGRTVADALVMAGLDPTGGVSTDPAVDTPIFAGMTISAKDVFYRVSEQEIAVPFETVVQGDPSLPMDRRVVVTKGSEGSAVRVWQSLVSGGVEGTRTLKAETVISAPVAELVRVGTRRAFRQVVPAGRNATNGSDGAPRPYTPPVVGKVVLVEATAYTPYACGVDADWIAWRRRLFDAPAGWGVVAVDRKVIPLGSRLFVEGYGYAIAGDTGSAIKGNKIDVCFWGASLSAPTGHASSSQRAAARDLAKGWGRRRGLRVTILGG